MELDWGDGDYARTAALLAPTAEVLLDAVAPGPGMTLLDVACGTGNVALAAAARGAVVTGVDASPRLVEAARARAAREGADARFLVGDAGALPTPDAAFDATVSAFGVIFADDPAAAAGEMLRATRPGGCVALTSWRASGPIFAAGRILRESLPAGEGPPARWDDPAWVRALLEAQGTRDVRIEEEAIAFTAASPESWLAEQEEHHPAWRGARAARGAGWAAPRGRMLAALEEGNEDPAAFRATSEYLVVVARR